MFVSFAPSFVKCFRVSVLLVWSECHRRFEDRRHSVHGLLTAWLKHEHWAPSLIHLTRPVCFNKSVVSMSRVGPPAELIYGLLIAPEPHALDGVDAVCLTFAARNGIFLSSHCFSCFCLAAHNRINEFYTCNCRHCPYIPYCTAYSQNWYTIDLRRCNSLIKLQISASIIWCLCCRLRYSIRSIFLAYRECCIW